MPDGRVLIATSGGPLTASPTWERFDELADCRCAGYDIQRGRQSELDITETGTARVYWNDRSQTLNDPDLVGRQILLQAWNPYYEEWVPQYRGVIDEPTFEVNPAGVKSDVQFNCVDIMDYLAACEMQLEDFGDVPPAGSEGTVFYEDGPVDDRITQLLDDAGIDPSMYVVFSGNVDVWETKYDPGDSLLVALRDAADAEFPGIANIYVDKYGRVVFHGRFARFDPDGVSAGAAAGAWDFYRWKAGDGAAIALDSDNAQIRAFAYNIPRSRIINSYISWPRYGADGELFPEADMPAQRSTAPTSIATHGWRGRSAGDLVIKEHKTNGNTGADECKLFADFYVANYAEPRTSIQRITLKAVRPDDPRAASTWQTMCWMDISDVINVTVGDAGVSGEDFYVEGVNVTVRPLNPEHDYMEVTPNLSPTAYYTTDVFNP